MKLLKFIFSKVFFLNLFIALIMVVVGLFVLDNHLDNLTKHGEKVAVPNVENSKIPQLQESLIEKGFRYEIMDSIWDRNLPKGIVVDQKPGAGDSVKQGRKIYLTINSRSDKMIKLSIGSIVNGTARTREALEYITTIDLVHDSTILVPHDFDDMVLGFKDAKGKDLKDGDKVKAGAKIWLVVGQDIGKKVRIPNVLGMRLDNAVKLVKNNLLNVNLIESSDGACITGIDSTIARISMQRPTCNENIGIGKEISLFYTCDTTFNISTECK
jgi:eukaryotic-like serine/threonine-protein kinase